MSKIGLEILLADKSSIAELRTRVTETKNAIWYKGTPGMGKLATLNKVGRYCETCKGKSHNTEDCWGSATFAEDTVIKPNSAEITPKTRQRQKAVQTKHWPTRQKW